MNSEEQSAVVNHVPLNRLSLKSTRDEVDIMRERLIIARVMNGFSVTEAQERLGQDDIDLESIESGKRSFPKDHRFLYKVAKAYSVSLDFLSGLSPNAEPDAVYSRQYALMRGFETILLQQAEATRDAFFNYLSRQDKLCREEYQAVTDSIDAVRSSLEVMRQKYGFDDIQGGAKLLAAVEGAEEAVKPIRKALAAQVEIEAYCKDLALGKIGPIAYLLDKDNGIYLEP